MREQSRRRIFNALKRRFSLNMVFEGCKLLKKKLEAKNMKLSFQLCAKATGIFFVFNCLFSCHEKAIKTL